MLKKMILALLLGINGTVAFAAQQEVVKQNETKQTTEQEQKETFTQKSKKALKTYFIRDTKIKTGLNIAAKMAAPLFIAAFFLKLREVCPNKNKQKHNETMCKLTKILAIFVISRELTNY